MNPNSKPMLVEINAMDMLLANIPGVGAVLLLATSLNANIIATTVPIRPKTGAS